MLSLVSIYLISYVEYFDAVQVHRLIKPIKPCGWVILELTLVPELEGKLLVLAYFFRLNYSIRAKYTQRAHCALEKLSMLVWIMNMAIYSIYLADGAILLVLLNSTD